MRTQPLPWVIQEIYDMAFVNRCSPKRYDTLSKNWSFIPFEKGIEVNKKKITELVCKHYDVKCCYMTTSIRGHHRYFIFYKINKP